MLLLGILVRKLTEFEDFGLMMILLGVTCKTIYIIAKIRNGEYRPGKELIYLFLGLLLFMTGIVLRKSDSALIYPIYLILSGLLLKIIYVIKFIRIVKRGRIAES